jgi:hypothetical protein
MYDAETNTIKDIRADKSNGMEDTDDARAKLAAIKKEGLVDMERFFLHQLFITGLRDELRSTIMKQGSLSLARE